MRFEKKEYEVGLALGEISTLGSRYAKDRLHFGRELEFLGTNTMHLQHGKESY